MTQSQYSSFLLYLARRILSIFLRFSFSKKFSQIITWPISRRLFGRGYSEIVSVDSGINMRVYGDMEDMVNKTLMFMSGYKRLSWEPVTSRFVEVLAKDAQCVVNAGAHIGYYSLLVSKINPNSKVFAFEPNPHNYERLVRNIALNSFKNIQAVPAAIGDKNTSIKMFFDFGQSSFVESRRVHAGEGIVQVHTLDSFFKESSVMPDLIVLDAEGYEPNILRGAVNVIDAGKPNIIFELNPKALQAAGESSDGLCRILSDRGYSLFVIEDDYNHSFSLKEPEIKIRPYVGSLSVDVSFVNVFATMNPHRYDSYINSL